MAKKKITKGLKKEMQKAFKKEWEKEYAYAQKRMERYCKNSDHKKPTTRREFLNAGMLSTGMMMLGPTIGSVLGKLDKAHAQECPVVDVANGPAPFIQIHASGGSAVSLAGVCRQTNGAELDSFGNIGLGNNPTFQQMFANDARHPAVFNNGRSFANGLLDTTNATTRQNTVQISCPVRDNGDSRDPVKCFLGQIEAIGRAGDKLGFLGDDDSATGTNGAPNPAFNIPSAQPLAVRRLNDILQAVELSGALQNLNPAQQQSLAGLIQSLSNSQTQRLTGLSGAANLAKAVECATDQNVKNVAQGAGGLTPPNNIQAIWNNFNDENIGTGRARQEAFGSMAYAVISGAAAGAVCEIGGFDIHNDRNDGRDFQEQGEYLLGRQVGKCLETAAVLGRKVCVMFTTNGSNNCNGGGTDDAFNSDSSSYSVNHMWLFDPAGAPQTVGNVNAQIGGLQANGSTNRDVFSATPEGAAAALFYNYAIFSGVEDKFDLVMGGNTLSAAQKLEARKLA